MAGPRAKTSGASSGEGVGGGAGADRAPVVVIGAGPAGLTAAHELAEAGDPVVVVEQDGVVGGISRTVERDGWRFDIGGHRFFTKVAPGRGVLAQGPPPTRTSCCDPG